MEPIISLVNVWERYRIKFSPPGKSFIKDIWAIKGINLKIYRGESICILGPNGSGKTTLLKLIMGLLSPDKGEIRVRARVGGVLDLGAGLSPELTGYENIIRYLGYNGCAEITDKIQQVIEFAELGEFIYAPLKAYSQGMFLRLSFSLAIHIDPEILLVDDVLAVGDLYFQKKCLAKLEEEKSQGKTIIIVTHDLNIAQKLCSRALMLDEGKIIEDGPLEKVRRVYIDSLGPRWGIHHISSQDLKVIFNNGRISLRWKGRAITTHLHIFATYLNKDTEEYSLNGSWEVDEAGQSSMLANGKIKKFNLPIYWHIVSSGPNAINMQFHHERKESFIQYLNIMLDENYDTLIIGKNIKQIPEHNNPTKDWVLLANYKADNIVICSRRANFLPALLLSTVNNYDKIEIYNLYHENIKVKILRFNSQIVNIMAFDYAKVKQALENALPFSPKYAEIVNDFYRINFNNDKLQILAIAENTTFLLISSLHLACRIKQRWYRADEAKIGVVRHTIDSITILYNWQADLNMKLTFYFGTNNIKWDLSLMLKENIVDEVSINFLLPQDFEKIMSEEKFFDLTEIDSNFYLESEHCRLIKDNKIVLGLKSHCRCFDIKKGENAVIVEQHWVLEGKLLKDEVKIDSGEIYFEKLINSNLDKYILSRKVSEINLDSIRLSYEKKHFKLYYKKWSIFSKPGFMIWLYPKEGKQELLLEGEPVYVGKKRMLLLESNPLLAKALFLDISLDSNILSFNIQLPPDMREQLLSFCSSFFFHNAYTHFITPYLEDKLLSYDQDRYYDLDILDNDELEIFSPETDLPRIHLKFYEKFLLTILRKEKYNNCLEIFIGKRLFPEEKTDFTFKLKII